MALTQEQTQLVLQGRAAIKGVAAPIRRAARGFDSFGGVLDALDTINGDLLAAAVAGDEVEVVAVLRRLHPRLLQAQGLLSRWEQSKAQVDGLIDSGLPGLIDGLLAVTTPVLPPPPVEEEGV